MHNSMRRASAADLELARRGVRPLPDGSFPGSDDDAVGREFIALYTRHARQIYAFIRTTIPNQADAEDTFQDVSVVLWEKFGQFQRGTNFSAWAIQVARYAILSFRQSKRRAASSFAEEFVDSIAAEMSHMEDVLEAQHRALADCYQRLNESDRSLLEQRYRAGVTVKDLSNQVGRPLRTVYRLIDVLHMRLLNCIERTLQGEGYSE